MMRAFLVSLALTAAATSACVGDQSYTPIGEGHEDELCQQPVLKLANSASVALEMDDRGNASYAGSLDVTHFSRTEMTVETKDIIVSVPGGSIASVEVEEGYWDLFTDMVLAIDVRKAGSSDWEQVSLETNAYDITWFTKVEFDGKLDIAAVSSLTLCSANAIGSESVSLPGLFLSEAYELRIRAFPFEGAGDLVGSYNYTVNVNIQ